MGDGPVGGEGFGPLPFELQPISDEGRRLVELAERHAVDFWGRAAEHDRAGTYVSDNIDELKASGFMAACVPAELGGGGVERAHDLVVAMSRLARGCPSTAIAAVMHVNGAAILRLRWRDARGRDPGAAANLEGVLRAMAGGAVLIAAGTEAGTGFWAPALTFADTADGEGFELNGRKIFVTLSPSADLLFVTGRYDPPDGSRPVWGFVPVPVGAPGVRFEDDWDALGMRGSGSQSVTFEQVVVPKVPLTPARNWGEIGTQGDTSAGVLPLASCFLGIAERAHQLALALAATRRKGPSGKLLAEWPAIQRLVAENQCDLVAARGAFAHAAATYDEVFGEPLADIPGPRTWQVSGYVQSAKAFAERACIRIVDRAMATTGGAGYLRSSPLERLYRDVRAGPFMHPFGEVEAYEIIGKTVFGFDPTPDH